MCNTLMRLMLYTLLIFSSIFWTITELPAQNIASGKKKIYCFEIKKEIMPTTWRLVQNSVAEAEEMQADAIVITMDTYGGLLDAADSIRTRLLTSKIPVIVYITNNAASAGCLISLACDSIYMAPIAKIGAASVVDESGNVLADKFQSYMRGMMRATAEATGRNADIAESFVGAIKTIPGIIDSGKVLTFTTQEAIRNNFCNAEVHSRDEAILKAGYSDYEVYEHEDTFIDILMGFFMNPIVHGLCLTIIFLGLYFEMSHPGFGVPVILAIIAALFYFAPLYLDGLAANWEIVMFVAGIILLVLEIFIIPGFGVAGVGGIILIFAGSILSLVRNDGFNFELSGLDAITQSVAIVLSSFLLTGIIIVLFFRRFLNSPYFKKIALQTEMRASDQYTSAIFTSPINLIGKKGFALTDLRPSGKIEVEGEFYEGQTNGEYILKGTEVEIIKVNNMYLIVKAV